MVVDRTFCIAKCNGDKMECSCALYVPVPTKICQVFILSRYSFGVHMTTTTTASTITNNKFQTIK